MSWVPFGDIRGVTCSNHCYETLPTVLTECPCKCLKVASSHISTSLILLQLFEASHFWVLLNDIGKRFQFCGAVGVHEKFPVEFRSIKPFLKVFVSLELP